MSTPENGVAQKVVVITGASSGIGEATARAVRFAIEQPENVDVSE
jgi:NADP-dependent 3-hydroxy acid dehydrogenase YdfG